MMFVARSAFWLTVAYLASGPAPVDLKSAASQLSAQAVAAGQTVIANQLLGHNCLPLVCPGGIAAGTIFPSVDSAMQDSSNPVPLPRPRPDRMG